MKNIQILIIDDEEEICKNNKRVLQKFNYQVEYIINPIQTMDKVNEYLPDIILLDLKMPQRDGLEVLKEIKRFSPNIKVIICSGYIDVKVQVNATEIGVEGFLSKPFSTKELLNCIEETFKENKINDLEREVVRIKN